MTSAPSPTTTDSTTLNGQNDDIEKQQTIPERKLSSPISKLLHSIDEGFSYIKRNPRPEDSANAERQSEATSSDATREQATLNGGILGRLERLLGFKVDDARPEDDVPQVRPLTRFIRGYPNLAAFHNSSENFMLYRRFGYLSSRVLLDKQDKLRQLEEKLDEFDDDNQGSSVTTEPNHRTKDTIDERNALLKTIESALSEYANSLAQAQQLMGFNKPSHSEQQSVASYIANHSPVKSKESAYVHFKEDLVTLRPGREHAWLDRMIEASLQVLQKPLPFVHRLFCSKETRMKVGDPEQIDDVYYYTRERIELCASGMITLAILTLLIVPVWLLYYVVTRNDGTLTERGTAICIGTLLVATLLFSAVLSLFTKAQRHEILASAAAYCAVLVVFLGNVHP